MQEFPMAGFVGEREQDDSATAVITLHPRHPGMMARGAARRLGAPSQKPDVAASLEPVAGRPQPADAPYLELDLSFSPSDQALWCYMKPDGPPSFTPGMVRELTRLHAWLAQPERMPGHQRPRFYVMGSRIPGIYNLGGDLAFLVDSIRAGNKAALTSYAHGCIEAVHAIYNGFGAPVISIGLVEGNALGGGLEGALCFHVLVAERGVKMGFPEVLFGSFPGMGAYSFLSRKLGARAAERMIMDGRIHTSEQLFEMGIVDVLAEPGHGRAAVEKWIADNRSRHALHHSMNRVRERVAPIALQELRDVTDIWVETALALEASDLRRMERLQAAQARSARRK